MSSLLSDACWQPGLGAVLAQYVELMPVQYLVFVDVQLVESNRNSNGYGYSHGHSNQSLWSSDIGWQLSRSLWLLILCPQGVFKVGLAKIYTVCIHNMYRWFLSPRLHSRLISRRHVRLIAGGRWGSRVWSSGSSVQPRPMFFYIRVFHQQRILHIPTLHSYFGFASSSFHSLQASKSRCLTLYLISFLSL